MEQPLGKKELYKRIKEVLDCSLPKCKDLVYSEYRGAEWLENRDFSLTSCAGGDWIGIHHFAKDKSGKEYLRFDIFADYQDGSYLSHYRNSKLL